MRLLACALLLWAAALGAAAATLEEREASLAASLRCMVCQNQSLAESSAPLAADMRRQIREQLAQGRSEQQIGHYFELRYGAFVRYDPPFVPSTWLLWLGPFALLGVGCAVLWRMVRRQRAAVTEPLTAAERARAEALLAGEAP